RRQASPRGKSWIFQEIFHEVKVPLAASRSVRAKPQADDSKVAVHDCAAWDGVAGAGEARVTMNIPSPSPGRILLSLVLRPGLRNGMLTVARGLASPGHTVARCTIAHGNFSRQLAGGAAP